MAKKVSSFKAAFVEQFITEKSKQYYLPRNILVDMIKEIESLDYDILNPKDREFAENFLAVNSVAYHNKRKK